MPGSGHVSAAFAGGKNMIPVLECFSKMGVLFAVFLIAMLGYAVGGIKIKGIELGTAGVLLVALVFGHFFGKGVMLDMTDAAVKKQFTIVQNIGLTCFVGAVGFIAGPKFFRDFKVNAKSYILLGFIIILSGALVTVLTTKVFGVRAELSVGLMTGALTSTPGLAAAQEAAASAAGAAATAAGMAAEAVEAAAESAKALATTGYGIAYPFGVVGVVLFVQLMPKFLKIDMAEERRYFESAQSTEVKKSKKKFIKLDAAGFFAFTAAIALGILLGKITIPLPGGATFSLGNTGGALIMGLLFGHFAHIGPVDVTVPVPALKTFRELGLMLFLIGAGVSGGAGFIDTLKEEGVMLFVYGALMTCVPMFVGFFIAKKFLKLRLLNNLGSITGGMTSTPALGTLISVAGTDDVASAYAATYPIALVSVVLCSQFIVILFG